MLQRIECRGASSPLPIVIAIVFLMLATLGVWMWVDMSRSDLGGKALLREEELRKSQGRASYQSPVATEPAPTPAIPINPGVYECHRAAGAVIIDGNPTDAAWRDAQIVTDFALPWLGQNHVARSRTIARLLWDDQFLYFLAEMDDTDVYADVTEHNGEIWNNDVFELFFKPSAASRAYYEFEINAKNTTLELFLPSRGAGGYHRFKNPDAFHLETKVTLRGASTLNNPSDRDSGWTVEGKIPWSDFARTGGKPVAGAEWKFALCRYDYSTELEEPELSTSAPLTQQNFHRYEDYSILKFK